jgi:uncharacterized protein (DUF983 family)
LFILKPARFPILASLVSRAGTKKCAAKITVVSRKCRACNVKLLGHDLSSDGPNIFALSVVALRWHLHRFSLVGFSERHNVGTHIVQNRFQVPVQVF